MAVTVTIHCASASTPGSYSLSCTQCSDQNRLGHYDDPVAAHDAARLHRCIFPQVTPAERRLGDVVERGVCITHKGSMFVLTMGEATALLANLATCLAVVSREQHAKGTRLTLDLLNVDVAASRSPQVAP